mmetsp:Transcript_31472/g.105961  ORF Transcript_31472/g.105961 Transcript_31472/m.105961 type:complete len:322 (+) Transcript_31472:189-1154(+)
MWPPVRLGVVVAAGGRQGWWFALRPAKAFLADVAGNLGRALCDGLLVPPMAEVAADLARTRSDEDDAVLQRRLAVGRPLQRATQVGRRQPLGEDEREGELVSVGRVHAVVLGPPGAAHFRAGGRAVVADDYRAFGVVVQMRAEARVPRHLGLQAGNIARLLLHDDDARFIAPPRLCPVANAADWVPGVCRGTRVPKHCKAGAIVRAQRAPHQRSGVLPQRELPVDEDGVACTREEEVRQQLDHARRPAAVFDDVADGHFDEDPRRNVAVPPQRRRRFAAGDDEVAHANVRAPIEIEAVLRVHEEGAGGVRDGRVDNSVAVF